MEDEARVGHRDNRDRVQRLRRAVRLNGNTAAGEIVDASMAYRSDLEAALARIDSLAVPCPTCAANERRRARRRRALVASIVAGATLVVLAFGTLAGIVAASVFLVGFGIRATDGDGSGACFAIGLSAALFSAALYAVFAWLSRRAPVC